MEMTLIQKAWLSSSTILPFLIVHLIYLFHPIIALAIVGILSSFRHFEDDESNTTVLFWVFSSLHFFFFWILYLATVTKAVGATKSLIAKVVFSVYAHHCGTVLATSVTIPKAERTEHDIRSVDSDNNSHHRTENRYSTVIVYSNSNKERFQITSDKKHVYDWSTENHTISMIRGHPQRYKLVVSVNCADPTFCQVLCQAFLALMGCLILIAVAAAAGMPLLMIWTKAKALQCFEAASIMAAVGISPGILVGVVDLAVRLPDSVPLEIAKPVRVECCSEPNDIETVDDRLLTSVPLEIAKPVYIECSEPNDIETVDDRILTQCSEPPYGF